MGPTRQGARPRGWACPAPSWPNGGFLVPEILKYSTKNHISFSGHLENFFFSVFFIARINQKTDRKILFLLYFH